ncbi:MAG: hypothetical protein H6958_10430 [Chromatiaceae bacterium]|nr:hypothetical protein [Chromatiaceae bacterium]
MTTDDIKRATSQRLVDSIVADIDTADALNEAWFAHADGVRNGATGLTEDAAIELSWLLSQRLAGAKAMVNELWERLRAYENAAEVGGLIERLQQAEQNDAAQRGGAEKTDDCGYRPGELHPSARQGGDRDSV